MSAPIGEPSLASTARVQHALALVTAANSFPPALLSVYDKTGLLPFAKSLKELGFRLLGSGGTARLIRDNGIEIEYVWPWRPPFPEAQQLTCHLGTCRPSPTPPRCSAAV